MLRFLLLGIHKSEGGAVADFYFSRYSGHVLRPDSLVIGTTTTLLLDFILALLDTKYGAILRGKDLKYIEFVTKEWPALCSDVASGSVHLAVGPKFTDPLRSPKGQLVLKREWVIAVSDKEDATFRRNIQEMASLNLKDIQAVLPEAIQGRRVNLVAYHIQPGIDLCSQLGIQHSDARLFIQPTSRACLEFAQRGHGIAVVPDPRIYRIDMNGLSLFKLPQLNDAEVSVYLPKNPRRVAKSLAEAIVNYGKEAKDEYLNCYSDV